MITARVGNVKNPKITTKGKEVFPLSDHTTTSRQIWRFVYERLRITQRKNAFSLIIRSLPNMTNEGNFALVVNNDLCLFINIAK